jgi:acetolactate synthase I/II/III large subunit
MTGAGQLARVAARALAEAGPDVLFGLPGGGSNLDIIGAAETAGLTFVLTHSEFAAAVMAGVCGELTGTPAACVVTRGPGAASSINGVAQALLDRQPMLVLTDAVPASDFSHVSHQRLDHAALFAPVTKCSGVLGAGDQDRVMREALSIATSQPHGPVHLDIDPTSESRLTASPSSPTATGKRPCLTAASAGGSMAAINTVLAAARKPVVVIGVGARHEAAAIRALLAGTSIPVLQTYKAKGTIPDSAVNAAGLMTGATIEARVLHAADVIVTIGLDAVELIPGSWPYAAPVLALSSWPQQASGIRPAAAAVGPLRELLTGLGRLPDGWDPGFAQRERQRGLDLLVHGPAADAGLAPWEVVQDLRSIAPAGSVATVDAGAHMLVAMPLWFTQNPGEVLVSSGLATMGFALPAAIAASLTRPGVRVFCLVGDGGLGMVLGELETAARLRLPLTIAVFNDSALSLIRIKQRASGQGGGGAVSYGPTDFARIAAGYGIRSAKVTCRQELQDAARRSLEVAGPMLLDLQVDASSYPHILAAIRGAA